MSTEQQSAGAIKTYVIGTDHVHTQRSLEIQHNDQPILWAVKYFGDFHRPEIRITTNGEEGPTLAAMSFKSMRGIRVMLGDDPDALPKEAWADVDPEGMTSGQHTFVFDDRPFWWKRRVQSIREKLELHVIDPLIRTHNKQYGASSLGGRDFKLIDGDEQVLAVYINDSRTFNVEDIGRIDYFVELGRELELFTLAAILGIQERIRRQRRNNAGGGAGAM
ncbi:hypothetical protein Slin15195_G032030 [Septoria linicola]|uniref:Uncharacterized protein n=1 Tax=Septoria linicola TaxID=215465 RepID=A0A9Q9AKY5_9PEZI|nr:hypothetical protein Slin14017_G031050 [Septoria linicola]USW49884.1 hypothetical protein Slin15195_G032030 [Septoria linicola]